MLSSPPISRRSASCNDPASPAAGEALVRARDRGARRTCASRPSTPLPRPCSPASRSRPEFRARFPADRGSRRVRTPRPPHACRPARRRRRLAAPIAACSTMSWSSSRNGSRAQDAEKYLMTCARSHDAIADLGDPSQVEAKLHTLMGIGRRQRQRGDGAGAGDGGRRTRCLAVRTPDRRQPRLGRRKKATTYRRQPDRLSRRLARPSAPPCSTASAAVTRHRQGRAVQARPGRRSRRRPRLCRIVQ